MIKNFQGFLFESNSVEGNYAFHFLESKDLLDFLNKFSRDQKEELSELLDPIFDDFGVDFKVNAFLTMNVNTKVGYGKKVVYLDFSKKWDPNLGEIVTDGRNKSGNLNLMPQIEKVFPRYQEIGRDLNQIYIHVSRIMEITDYKIEAPTKTRFNRVNLTDIRIRFELHSDLLEVPEIKPIYSEYASNVKIDPEVTKWYNESMEKLEKIFPKGSIPGTEILCQFVEEEEVGHWDIYANFEEEYYSLSTYWLSDKTTSFHQDDVDRLKLDIKRFGR